MTSSTVEPEGPPPDTDGAAERPWVLALLAAVLLARAPVLAYAPRFWAEDGTVYFAYARLHGLLESLLLVPTTSGPAGYLNLAANLPAWMAASLVSREWLPLEWAPLVPTFFAFALQLLPVALVLYGNLPALARPLQRRLAAVLLVVSPPLLAEVWGNATNSQIFLGLAATLVLSEDFSGLGRRGFAIRAWVVGLAALSGPYTAFLAPLFLLRAGLDGWHQHRRAEPASGEPAPGPHSAGPGPAARSRGLALLVSLAAFCQAAVYFWTREALGFSERSVGGGPMAERLAALFRADFLDAFLGDSAGTAVAKTLGFLAASARPGELATGTPGWVGGLAVAILFGAAFWLAAGALRSGPPPGVGRLLRLVPVLAALWLSLAVGLAVGPLVVVERYSVLPGALWLLATVAAMDDPASTLRRMACRAGLGWALMVGVMGYYREIPPSALGQPEGRPSWSEEVAAWREEPERLSRIWPYADPEPWYLYLQPAEAPVTRKSRIRRPVAMISDGRWQERSWQVDGLGHDFKMIVRFVPSVPSTSLRLHLRFEDEHGASLSVLRPPAFVGEKPVRWILERDDPRLAHIPMNRVRRLTLATRPESAGAPVRLLVRDLYLGPRIEGALESLLPDGWPARRSNPAASSVGQHASGPRDGESGWHGLLASSAFLLLVLALSRAPIAGGKRGELLWPALFLSASANVALVTRPSLAPLWMLLAYWPMARWIGGSAAAKPRIGLELAAGAAASLVAIQVPVFWLLVALPVAERLWRFARSESLPGTSRLLLAWLVGIGIGIGTAIGIAPGLGERLANPVTAPLSEIPPALPDYATSWAERAWQLGFGAEGWLGLYPLAFVALVIMLVAGRSAPHDSASDSDSDNGSDLHLDLHPDHEPFASAAGRRTALLGALLAIHTGWIFLPRGVLSDIPLAMSVLYPLFWLLPDRIGPADGSRVRSQPRVVRLAWVLGLLLFVTYTLPGLERRATNEEGVREWILEERTGISARSPTEATP